MGKFFAKSRQKTVMETSVSRQKRFFGVNPKSEIRNPTRCDGATARREQIRIGVKG
jgi:hypothetical protein